MPSFILAVLQVAVVIALPFVVARIFRLALFRFAHEEFFQVPILSTMANLQGVLAGIVLMRVNLDKEYFDIEQMFASYGPWDITLPQFLFERVNLFLYNPLPLFRSLANISSEDGLVAGFIIVVLPLLWLITAAVMWGFKDLMRSLVTSSCLAIWAGWLTIYIISATFWILHLLNFWSLIILLLYLQYRYDRSSFEGWWSW